MRFGVYFLLLGGLLGWLAVQLGGIGWLLIWPTASLWGVAVAYLANAPSLFGKTPTGRLRWPHRLVLAPWQILQGALWTVVRMTSRRPAFDRVGEHLFVGRRPLAGELPDGVDHVVDLTSEFGAVPEISTRAQHQYHCLPTLDGSVPPLAPMLALLDTLAAAPDAVVFVHCAQGHGRTGLFAAAWLLWTRRAVSADEAIARLQRCRPRIRLGGAQRRFLARLEAMAAAR